MKSKFKIRKGEKISIKDINNLMVCALEGGITYWCGGAKVRKVPTALFKSKYFASDIIGYGGTLELYDVEEPADKWLLTRKKLIKGIKMEMENGKFTSVQDLMDNHDADTADNIIQFALFNDIIYC